MAHLTTREVGVRRTPTSTMATKPKTEDNVKVAVRVRPINEQEQQADCQRAVEACSPREVFATARKNGKEQSRTFTYAQNRAGRNELLRLMAQTWRRRGKRGPSQGAARTMLAHPWARSSPVRALHPWCCRYDHSFGEETTQVLDGLGFMYVCGARGLAGVDPYGIPTLWRSYAARACACSHGWS